MSNQNQEVRDVSELPAVVGSVTALQPSGQLDMAEMEVRMQRVVDLLAMRERFIKETMEEGIDRDYAVIPGCGKKKTMLKPCAEKLLEWFGYYADLTLISSVEDRDGGYFEYQYRATIKQRGSNIVIGTCDRECNSKESRWGSSSAKPFDIKDNIRAKAQKRAFVGATRIATATSDIFAEEGTTDNDTGATTNGTSNGDGQKSHQDYGNPISDAQGKRLYAIAKKCGVDIDKLTAWLAAKYGFDGINSIGWKLYNEIVAQVETGTLPKVEPEKPQGDGASSGKVGDSERKNLAETLARLGKKSGDFVEFVKIAYPQYQDVKDILAADYPVIIAAFEKAVMQ